MPDSKPHSLDFYHDLPAHENFDAIADEASFSPLPKGWSVLVADVEDSTNAIRTGRYKDVTTLGTSVLAGVFNALGTLDVPFIFGGDGACVVLPDALVPRVLPALDSARRTGRQVFGLGLRTGVVPLDELTADGFDLAVARVRLSEHVTLAAFTGGALHEAERRIREHPERYGVPAQPGAANLSGLECRWDGIRSPGGVMLSLLVTPSPWADTHEVLTRVLAKINALHPESGPLARNMMKISADAGELAAEHRVKHHARPAFLRRLALLAMQAETFVGRFLIENRVRVPGVLDLRDYKSDVIRNSDHRKYDGTLRLVLATDPVRKEKLETWLSDQHHAGLLAYGTHADPEAILTCLVMHRKGRHLHFLDVGNGGYAAAAVGLKQRLAHLDQNAS